MSNFNHLSLNYRSIIYQISVTVHNLEREILKFVMNYCDNLEKIDKLRKTSSSYNDTLEFNNVTNNLFNQLSICESVDITLRNNKYRLTVTELNKKSLNLMVLISILLSKEFDLVLSVYDKESEDFLQAYFSKNILDQFLICDLVEIITDYVYLDPS